MKDSIANENKKKASGLRRRLATSRSVRKRSERPLSRPPKTSRSLLTSSVTLEAQEGAAYPTESKQPS